MDLLPVMTFWKNGGILQLLSPDRVEEDEIKVLMYVGS